MLINCHLRHADHSRWRLTQPLSVIGIKCPLGIWRRGPGIKDSPRSGLSTPWEDRGFRLPPLTSPLPHCGPPWSPRLGCKPWRLTESEDEKLGACFSRAQPKAVLLSSGLPFCLWHSWHRHQLGSDRSGVPSNCATYHLEAGPKASWASVSCLQNGHLAITQPVWWMMSGIDAP